MKLIFRLVLLLPLFVSAQSWKPIESHPNSVFYSKLADYHAPVIYQQVGSNPIGDTITRMDFDGDFVANNNWVNLDRYAAPAYVYYSVIESESHYFISYSFFHARDYSNICFTIQCHENDLEGAVLTIYKDGSQYGSVRLLETMAHNQIITFRVPQLVALPRSQDSRKRVAIFIERQGHGVKAWDIQKQGPQTGERIISGRNGVQDLEITEAAFLSNFLVYFPGANAEVPAAGAREGDYSYQLLNVETEFWNRQNLTGMGSLWIKQWDYEGARKSIIRGVAGAFAGQKYTTGSANAPWAWADNSENVLKRGDWFFDPAHYVASRINLKEPVSVKYVYNPYLQ